MISHSFVSILFALLPLLVDSVALQPAQSAITQSVTLPDSMPGMGQATSAMSSTSSAVANSADLMSMMNNMNQIMTVMNRMIGDAGQRSGEMQGELMDSSAMQSMAGMTMTDSAMTGSMIAGSAMNGMSGNMSTDMMMMMNNMNEMMKMCMADMMNNNKKWYWIGGITLALLLLGLLGWWLCRNRTRFMHNDSPLLILQRRLAQGEITLEQYAAVRTHLGTGGVAADDKELNPASV